MMVTYNNEAIQLFATIWGQGKVISGEVYIGVISRDFDLQKDIHWGMLIQYRLR